MGKSLTNEADVQSTQKSFEDVSRILKFDENSKTPVYLLSPNYEEGYVHWVKLPDGRSLRVVCGGGIEGKGFDPSNCKICNYMVDGYREARTLSASDEKAGVQLKNQLNQMRAKFSAEFLAVKGELLTVKDAKTGKRGLLPDFEEYEVGVLALTEAQFNELVSLRGHDAYPYMKTYKDFMNRVILVDKRKRARKGKKAKYATIEFVPMKRQSDVPEIEYNADEFDISKDFEIDPESIEKAFVLLSGGDVEEVDDDSDIEYVENEGTVEDVEDTDVEDVEDTDVEYVEAEEESVEDEVNDLSDIESEDSEAEFENDLPWEKEDDEPKQEPVKETTGKKRQVQKTTGKTTRKSTK